MAVGYGRLYAVMRKKRVVQAGKCKIETGDGEVRTASVGSGILTVGEEKTILLSGEFEWE